MSWWTRAEFLGASVKQDALSHRSREVNLWLWQTFKTNHVFSRTVLNLWYTFGDVCPLLCTFWQLEMCVNISAPLDNTHHTLSVWSRSHTTGWPHHSLQQAESTWHGKGGHDKAPSTPCPIICRAHALKIAVLQVNYAKFQILCNICDPNVFYASSE